MPEWFAIGSECERQTLLLVFARRQTRIFQELGAPPRAALGTFLSFLVLLEFPLLLDRFDFGCRTSRAVAWFADDLRFEDGDEIVLILRGIRRS